ncbi:hypothetical protein IC582_004776 [Cucumis melo]
MTLLIDKTVMFANLLEFWIKFEVVVCMRWPHITQHLNGLVAEYEMTTHRPTFKAFENTY